MKKFSGVVSLDRDGEVAVKMRSTSTGGSEAIHEKRWSTAFSSPRTLT